MKQKDLGKDKKSKFLENQAWFGEALSKEEVKIFIKKYFTIIWLRFLKLQIPFLMRHRNTFKDLETWNVWGVIAIEAPCFNVIAA